MKDGRRAFTKTASIPPEVLCRERGVGKKLKTIKRRSCTPANSMTAANAVKIDMSCIHKAQGHVIQWGRGEATLPGFNDALDTMDTYRPTVSITKTPWASDDTTPA